MLGSLVCLSFKAWSLGRTSAASIFLGKEDIIWSHLCLGKHHVKELLVTFPIKFLWARFYFYFFCSLPASAPAPPITRPLRAVYKQQFPPPQHVPRYLCCKTQICMVNGHTEYKMAWPSPAPSFDDFFCLRGLKLKHHMSLNCVDLLVDGCEKHPCVLFVFPGAKSVSNGNHMPNANIISGTSGPTESCVAPPPVPPRPPTQTHTPPTTSDVSPFVSHGVSSSVHSSLLYFVRVFPVSPLFLCLQLSCHSSTHSLTLQASTTVSSQPPTWRILRWNRSGGCKNPVRRLYRYTSVVNQLFYCNRGAALMWRGLFW